MSKERATPTKTNVQFPILPLAALNADDFKVIFDILRQHLEKQTIIISNNQQQLVKQIDHINELFQLLSLDIRYQTALLGLFNSQNRDKNQLANNNNNNKSSNNNTLSNINKPKQNIITTEYSGRYSGMIDTLSVMETIHNFKTNRLQQHYQRQHNHLFPLYKPLITHTIILQHQTTHHDKVPLLNFIMDHRVQLDEEQLLTLDQGKVVNYAQLYTTDLHRYQATFNAPQQQQNPPQSPRLSAAPVSSDLATTSNNHTTFLLTPSIHKEQQSSSTTTNGNTPSVGPRFFTPSVVDNKQVNPTALNVGKLVEQANSLAMQVDQIGLTIVSLHHLLYNVLDINSIPIVKRVNNDDALLDTNRFDK